MLETLALIVLLLRLKTKICDRNLKIPSTKAQRNFKYR
jgi:hypothetical protein